MQQFRQLRFLSSTLESINGPGFKCLLDVGRFLGSGIGAEGAAVTHAVEPRAAGEAS